MSTLPVVAPCANMGNMSGEPNENVWLLWLNTESNNTLDTQSVLVMHGVRIQHLVYRVGLPASCQQTVRMGRVKGVNRLLVTADTSSYMPPRMQIRYVVRMANRLSDLPISATCPGRLSVGTRV